MDVNNSKKVITRDGMNEAKKRLNFLITTRRQEVAEQIATARAFGDLSENAEYDEARNEQGRVEAEIKELEDIIRNAEVVDESEVNFKVVNIGTTVTVYSPDEDQTDTYDIVGARESDPNTCKISNESPMGKALLGHKKGDKVMVEAPFGAYVLQIKKIERTKK